MGFAPNTVSWQSLVNFAEQASSPEKEAEEAYSKAIEMAAKTLGEDHPEVATICIYLGDFYCCIQRYKEAEAAYKRAKSIFEKSYSPEHMLVAMAMRNIAEVKELQGLPEEAKMLREQARSIFG